MIDRHSIPVSSDGVPLTEDLLRQLVVEAEHGYDPARLRVRGRPRLGAGPSEVVPVRLDPDLRRALDARAVLDHTTASDVVRRALRAYLSGA
jgi:hypothetical protein